MSETFVPQFQQVGFDPFSGPEIHRVIPITESQMEIWLSCALGGDQANSAYNESNSLRFKGIVNVSALQKAVATLVERHESLRSSFSEDGKSMLIYKSLPNQFLFKDLSDLSHERKADLLKEYLAADAMHVFNLVNGPLFKATLLKLAVDEYHFTFTAHHLVIDGWSIGVVMEELGKLYTAYVQEIIPDMPPAKSFLEFSLEQNKFLDSNRYREIEDFWLNQFKGKIPVVNLPADHPRPLIKTYESSRLDHELDKSLVSAIRKLGIEAGCTFVNTLLTAFEIFLYRITGQEDIIVGIPASGQADKGYYHLVGHCVNLLPLRSQPNGDLSFLEYLSLRKPAIFDAYENQQLTFGSLLKKLKISRDPSRIPLVPVVFNVDFGMEEGVYFENLEFRMISNPKAFLNFEWFLNVNGSKESVVLEWTYSKQLFESGTMLRMMNGFDALLKSIASNPSQIIDAIQIFEQKETIRNLQDSLGLSADFSKFQPVHQLITNAATKFADKVAIFFNDSQCSYRELNEAANQLAHFLIHEGLQKGDIIGIVLDRSIESVIAILATLKAGGAYLPIDTDYPPGRIEYMLQDSAKIHITQKTYKNQFSTGSKEILYEDFDQQRNKYSVSNPTVTIQPNDAAYIIYTSGSTGRPKGVVLEHNNLFNFLVTVSETPGISHQDRFLAVSSISFDIAILEVLLPYVHGAQSFVLDKYQRKDPQEILDVIDAKEITLMFATPTHWKMMLESGWQKSFPQFSIISGGEALSNVLSDKLLPLCHSLWNIYGPTETTVYSTIKKIERLGELITVGKPVLNTWVYILDDQLHPVKTGDEGEIYIAGSGVARGYLNLPELTAERFLKDPFHPEDGNRMYRTGDIGKVSPDGEIIILGRKDHQIKLRGHRIELGEIEYALTKIHGIKDAVVVAKDDSSGNPRLIAYLILSSNESMGKRGTGNNAFSAKEATSEEVKNWKEKLSLHLPSYMIPAHYVVMDQFPTTASGKTDRKSLPEPLFNAIEEDSDKLLAETPEERLVAEIWQDALGIQQVSITDNFFDMGGHSLIAVQVMTRLRKESNIMLPISVLFEYPTVQKLAQLLKSKENTQSWKSLVPIKPTGNKTPLYIVHGGGLNVMPFYSIAKHLDPLQPLYGIQAFGLNGIDKPHSTVEAIAAQYVEEILTQNPNGPYALAGYSFGGIIAFEMAKQLKAQGKKIKALIMFDTYAFKSDHKDPALKKTLNWITNEIGKRIFDLEMVLNNPRLFKRIKKSSWKKKLRKVRKSLPFSQQDSETEIIKIIKSIKEVHKEAGKNYVFSPYDGDIYLFRAKIRTSYLRDFEYFGWKPYVNKVNVIKMEGEHTTMFEPPHERNFVKVLQDILNNS